MVYNKDEAKCLYLLNNDYNNIIIENSNIKYIIFNKDDKKDLLYSKHIIYNNNSKDFIYKLSVELEKCRKLN